MERLRGRVIGHDGKARSMIEGLTETHIVVYGKTIGVIGEIERVAMARQAVELLLGGSPHGNVYKWLEKKRRELNRKLLEEE
jgi:ribosomal RNA assembly protein